MKNIPVRSIIIGLLILTGFLLSFQYHYTAEVETIRADARAVAERNVSIEHKETEAALRKKIEEMEAHIVKQNLLIENN